MPKTPPKAGEKHAIRYRLTSTAQDPPGVSTEGQVKATYIMSSYGRKDEYIVMVDFAWKWRYACAVRRRRGSRRGYHRG